MIYVKVSVFWGFSFVVVIVIKCVSKFWGFVYLVSEDVILI